jgi:UPF0755 protein
MPARKRLRLMLLLILFLIMVAVVAAAAGFYLNRAPATTSLDGAMFRVEKGESLASIAERLEKQRLIRSAFYLRLLSRVKGTENSFKTGTYKILPGFTVRNIHDLLVSGKQNLIRITIPEGWTIKKIANELEELGITASDGFVKAAYSARMVNELAVPGDSVEGYLFPDTYFFPEGYPPDAVIRTMVEVFFVNLKEIRPDYELWKRRDLHEKVILASIVEREYQVASEAPLIASVFINRLKYNIGLESCATLAYIITEIQGRPHPEYITQADTQIDSSYNTYKWHGLPPGPISNPGRIALDAAFHPAETDYYYFLRKDAETGEHYFSSDLDEHNVAKRFYLKAEPSL